MAQEYYWQASSLPDSSVGMFVFVDTPRKSYADCKRIADDTFGPGRYTIKRITEQQALPLLLL